jgi:hypothetical protein
MDEPAGPPLSPYAREQLGADLYRVDEIFWERLTALQVSVITNLTFMGAGPTPPGPPKRPLELKSVLHSYAEQLFYVEASKYPPTDPDFVQWLIKLSPKLESHIMRRLKELEAKSFMKSLRYHEVTEEAMREAIGVALQASIKKFAGDREVPQASSLRSGPDHPVARLVRATDPPKQPTRVASKTLPDGEIERRKKLLEEYKAATSASNKKIYEARNSGVHKPQFYEWINGELSAESATAQNFERFLVAKKPPIPRDAKN